jgi:beta-phosphoglucomutase-like phosphatase (HAD superfamily)
MGATAMSPPDKPITPDHFDAVLFDLDGVLTSTAKIHSRCWKTMFDGFLRRRSAAGTEPFRPFDIGTDYKLKGLYLVVFDIEAARRARGSMARCHEGLRALRGEARGPRRQERLVA